MANFDLQFGLVDTLNVSQYFLVSSQSKIFLGRFSDYGGQACDVTPDFCGIVLLIIVGPWLAYVAFIEGNFPQWGPQYIAVFDGTIPLLYHLQVYFLQMKINFLLLKFSFLLLKFNFLLLKFHFL